MNYNHWVLSKVYRFRRFTRKRYAAFQSMHKQVTIGHVSGRIADLELLKAGKTLLLACAGLLMFPENISAEDAPPDGMVDPTLLQIDEVRVVAERSHFQSEQFRLVSTLSHSEIACLPIQTASDLLNYLPGIDMRERGPSGVQGDLTMRGGTAKQVKILLNGIDITDPQTEHYSMDLPIDASEIERIEILQGTNYSVDAFSGAINIVTYVNPDTLSASTQYSLRGSLRAGEYGLIQPQLSAQVSKGEWHLKASGSYNRSSGYAADTDYKLSNVYLHTGWRGLQFQAGAQMKDAGANAFYTVKYPNQFDQTRTLITSLAYELNRGNWNLQTSAYYRAHFDRFHTYRDNVDLEGQPAPEWYKGPNQTWTHVSGAHLQGSYSNDRNKLTAGIALRDELVGSSSLGNHNRLHLRYFAEDRVYWRSLSVSVGASGIWNSQFGHDWAIGANIGYEPIRNWHLFLNFNRAIRIPTYTDLYYHTATQQADSATRAEKALQLEFATRYQNQHLYVNAAAYYRWGRDIIDWVKEPDPAITLWHSTNHSRVNAAGTEITLGVQGYEWIRRAEVSYSFADVRCDAGDMLSLYALDYLRHKASVRIEHKIWRGFGASWCLRVESRKGEYTATDGSVQAYQPTVLLDGSIFWQNEFLRLSLDARNMTNSRYVDIGGVVQPPHWVSGKIAFKL